MLERLERRFGVRSRGSSLRTEVVAGITTYMALAYIVLVNPVVLAGAGNGRGGGDDGHLSLRRARYGLDGAPCELPYRLGPGYGA